MVNVFWIVVLVNSVLWFVPKVEVNVELIPELLAKNSLIVELFIIIGFALTIDDPIISWNQIIHFICDNLWYSFQCNWLKLLNFVNLVNFKIPFFITFEKYNGFEKYINFLITTTDMKSIVFGLIMLLSVTSALDIANETITSGPTLL